VNIGNYSGGAGQDYIPDKKQGEWWHEWGAPDQPQTYTRRDVPPMSQNILAVQAEAVLMSQPFAFDQLPTPYAPRFNSAPRVETSPYVDVYTQPQIPRDRTSGYKGIFPYENFSELPNMAGWE